MQGDFLSLIIEEDTNLSWKWFLWGVSRGVAKFAINAVLNTLPTGDNLKRWGKRVSDICRMCNLNAKQTLNHTLSSCSASLEQGRFTWRHDSVLRTIYDFVSCRLREGFSIYSDLTGQGAGSGGTVPPDILVTSQRPDMVLINRKLRQIVVFEMTYPWDMNIDRSHGHKCQKYASF
jgi:hypothetical protein